MSHGFVIDASVIADALGVQDVRGNVAREFLVDHSLFSAPDILIAETYNALRRMWLRNLFTVQQFAKSIWSPWILASLAFLTCRVMLFHYCQITHNDVSTAKLVMIRHSA